MNKKITLSEWVGVAVAIILITNGYKAADAGLLLMIVMGGGYTIFCGISVLHWLLKPRQ